MLAEEIIEKIKKICRKYAQIQLLYVFGSQARGDAGHLSDHDFAIYLSESDSKKRFAIKLKLMNDLAVILGSDNVDLMVLNDTESPFLKFAAIKDGILIFEKGSKVLVETAIMSEYFDLRESFLKYDFAK